MADDKETELELDKSAGNKKKKIIIIVAAVVVLALGGAGAFFFLGGDSEPTSAEIDAALDSTPSSSKAKAEEEEMQTGTAMYVPMPRPFRFNIPGAARDRFVEIRVQLLVRGGDNEMALATPVSLVGIARALSAGAVNPQGSGDHVRLHAMQSRINFDARSNTEYGTVRAFIEGDFYGTGGNETISNSGALRLRHAFVQLDWEKSQLLTAQTNKLFDTETFCQN